LRRVILHDERRNLDLTVDGSSARLGRDPSLEITFASDDDIVSAVHARVWRDADGAWWLEDLGSTNGTWLGGRRIAAREALRTGDRFTLGQRGPALTVTIPGQVARTRRQAAVDERQPRLRLRRVRGGEDLVGAGRELVVGRDAACAIPLRTVVDTVVSKRHAVVTFDDAGAARIADAGSTNGTFVNGRQLEGPAPLALGDRIMLGWHGPLFEVRALGAATLAEGQGAAYHPELQPPKTLAGMLQVARGEARRSGAGVGAFVRAMARQMAHESSAFFRLTTLATIVVLATLLVLAYRASGRANAAAQARLAIGKRLADKVEGARRQKTPNEIALTILLVGLTIIFLLATATIEMFASYAGTTISLTILIALLVTLIPTTIGGLLSAIGIAGMDRLVKYNVLAMSGRAVEAAGDVDTLLLDKTGTITLGNRMATEFVPVSGVSEHELADAAQLASLSDETPEGRSIVVLAKERYGLRGRELADLGGHFIAFAAQTRMSGVDLNGSQIRKGAVDSILAFTASKNGTHWQPPSELAGIVERIAKSGGTPLAVAKDDRVLGVIHLKDIVKGGIRERFTQLRSMGIRTVMITGDNPVTAAAIAAEAGVDDFLAQATPENKLALIREEQGKGKLVAMCGDGTNDAPALAQADVGVAMNTGTSAAKEAGNMVDLDSNPTKLLEIVEIGKQLLITRGSLTTFSIANDVAKYFAIIPAMFVATYPELNVLNVMRLATPQSAILSAIIFNALIIIALIPLALRGVKYRPLGAAAILRRNLFVYGLGGLVVPFIGIKIIDVFVRLLGWA
jgi:K+-transporting ATPase ATPase B chain